MEALSWHSCLQPREGWRLGGFEAPAEGGGGAGVEGDQAPPRDGLAIGPGMPSPWLCVDWHAP